MKKPSKTDLLEQRIRKLERNVAWNGVIHTICLLTIVRLVAGWMYSDSKYEAHVAERMYNNSVKVADAFDQVSNVFESMNQHLYIHDYLLYLVWSGQNLTESAQFIVRTSDGQTVDPARLFNTTQPAVNITVEEDCMMINPVAMEGL
jgi:hypothetical protein